MGARVIPTQAMIDEALDQAKANGYDFREEPAGDVAVDLGTYHHELERAEIDAMIPFIRDWQKRAKT